MYFVTYVTVIYLSFESIMKEIRRQFLSPQTPLSQSKRAAKSPQRSLHSTKCEMPTACLQEQHSFIFQNHSGSSIPLLLFFSSCSSTHIICAKPCSCVRSNACLQLVVVFYLRFCVQGTVRPNKWKCWHLEQGKVYCRGHARSTGS